MGFTTLCFIRKNTPELLQKLEGLGYRYTSIVVDIVGTPDENYKGSNIKSYFNGKYITTNSEPRHPNFVDCGDNEVLFLALAALRDDTNKHQWFVAHCPLLFNKLKNTVETEDNRRYVSAGGWFHLISERAEFKWMTLSRPESFYHKAAPSELIEHFKKQ